MNPLDLNLASRPMRNNTLLWVAHAALAIGILGGTTWNVTAYVRHERDLDVLNAERNSFESRMSDLQRRENSARRGIGRYDLNDLNLRADKAGDVIERKALSWTRLFNRMEEVLPYEVRMATIRPVFSFGRQGQKEREKVGGGIPVSVEGSAKTLQAFLEFERALIQDAHFDQIEPHRFNRGDGTEVVFEMRFLYFPTAETPEPAAPDEEQSESPVVADGDVELPEVGGESPPVDVEVVEVEDPGPLPEAGEVTEVVIPEPTAPPAASPERDAPRTKGRRNGRRGKDPSTRAVRPQRPANGGAEAQAADNAPADPGAAAEEQPQDAETEEGQNP